MADKHAIINAWRNQRTAIFGYFLLAIAWVLHSFFIDSNNERLSQYNLYRILFAQEITELNNNHYRSLLFQELGKAYPRGSNYMRGAMYSTWTNKALNLATLRAMEKSMDTQFDEDSAEIVQGVFGLEAHQIVDFNQQRDFAGLSAYLKERDSQSVDSFIGQFEGTNKYFELKHKNDLISIFAILFVGIGTCLISWQKIVEYVKKTP